MREPQTARESAANGIEAMLRGTSGDEWSPRLMAEAACNALGIPADATEDEVRAGLALLRMVTRDGSPEVCTWWAPDGYRARFRPLNRGGIIERGPSPAAAVLSLANKLQEQT